MEKHQSLITLSAIDDAPIYYTLDGSEPTTASTRYTEPVSITASTEFRAAVIRPDGFNSSWQETFSFNKATLCPVTFLTVEPFPNYTFDGPVLLVDGRKGNENFATGAWMGFASDRAVELLVDLQQPTEVKHISVNTMTYMDAWIMAPTSVTASVSTDGKEFTAVGTQGAPVDTDIHKPVSYTHLTLPTSDLV